MGAEYSGLRDMIDGGGAGQAGAEFEGGGLMSMIANMMATPYGSQQQQPDVIPMMSSQSGPNPQQQPSYEAAPPLHPTALMPYQAGYQPPSDGGGVIDTQPLMAGGMSMDEIRSATERPTIETPDETQAWLERELAKLR